MPIPTFGDKVTVWDQVRISVDGQDRNYVTIDGTSTDPRDPPGLEGNVGDLVILRNGTLSTVLIKRTTALTGWEDIGTVGIPGSAADIHNVIEYGAVADGTTNNRTAIGDAITAANAARIATGRRQTVYFPRGVYAVRRDAATPIAFFDIDGMSDLIFLGEPGPTSVIKMTGDMGSNDAWIFEIDGGSNNIFFQDLHLLQDGITNPDPGQQCHNVQVGDECSNISFYRCEFQDTIGDGLRLIGNFGLPVVSVDVVDCRFTDCLRSGISFQRWVQNATVRGNIFTGGTDQQLDMEPTGYSRNATGGGATTLIDATATFTTWGIVAGDLVFNQTENSLHWVVSVDSQTQLTVSAGATSWSGDTYYFPKHNTGHIFTNNQFRRTNNTPSLIVTLTQCQNTTFSNNVLDGTIQGGDLIDVNVVDNHIRTPKDDNNDSGIDFIKYLHGVRIAGNHIELRSTTITDQRGGISCSHAAGRSAESVNIEGNVIRLQCRGSGIANVGVRYATIRGNQIILDTPGDTGQSVGINCTSLNQVCKSLIIEGNTIWAESGSGTYDVGITAAPVTVNMDAVLISGNSIADSGFPIRLPVSGAAFTSPPVIGPNIIEDGASPVDPSAAGSWVLLAGVGGTAPFTNSRKPGVYWGDGSPESVLAAGVGCIAMRRNGTLGETAYLKITGTGNTGWAPIGGVAATGSITCTTKANYAAGDADFMTIGDGLRAPVRYDFDVDGVYAGSNVQVNISADTTAAQVAARLKTAIEANQPAITVSDAGAGVLTLTHDAVGTLGNVTITENVTNAAHTVTGMAGGVNAARS